MESSVYLILEISIKISTKIVISKCHYRIITIKIDTNIYTRLINASIMLLYDNSMNTLILSTENVETQCA